MKLFFRYAPKLNRAMITSVGLYHQLHAICFAAATSSSVLTRCGVSNRPMIFVHFLAFLNKRISLVNFLAVFNSPTCPGSSPLTPPPPGDGPTFPGWREQGTSTAVLVQTVDDLNVDIL